MPKIINLDPARRDPWGLSSGAVGGGFAFATGMALDWASKPMRRVVDAVSVRDEVEICIQRAGVTLEHAGCTIGDVVKITCYISVEEYRDECLDALTDTLGPGPVPTRTVVVAGLACDCRVELDTVALVPAAVPNT